MLVFFVARSGRGREAGKRVVHDAKNHLTAKISEAVAINKETVRYLYVFKRIIAISITLFSVLYARAQYDVVFSHYWLMETSFNPAAAGKGNKLNAVGAYQMSFTGYEGNPNTFYVGADLPLYFMRQYHGVGLSLLNDKIGAFTHQRIAGQYAFRKNLFGGMISAGVQLGLVMEKFDGTKIDLDDTSDPAFNRSQISGNALDVGFGLYYVHKLWYVGVSGQHLTGPTVALGETNEMKVDPTFYLTGGYNIKLRNPYITVPTSVLARYDGTAYRADITARVVYQNEKKRMYAGVGYSPTNSVTGYIGGSFQGINVGYSYEMFTGGAGLGNGTHELMVSYQLDINLQKKGRNLHKSARIL